MKRFAEFVSGARLALLAVAVIVSPLVAQAQDVFHVRAGATGSNNGSDWNNAYPALPATLKRGATYYVANGTYGGYKFDDPVSGTQVITIKKATESEHGSSTGWKSTYGGGQAVFDGTFSFTTGYYLIDGVTGGGPNSDWSSGSEYGFRVIAPNNTSRKLVRFDADVSNIEFSRIDFSYDNNDGRSYPDDTVATSQDAVYSLNSVSNTRWSYCRFNRPGRTAFLTRKVWSNITVEYCYFRDSVIGNQLGQHGEIWSANHSAGNFKNITLRYNWFRNFRSTGGLIMSGADGVHIYGNVFETGGGSKGGNGAIGNWSSQPVSVNIRVYNNTFVKMGDSRVLVVGNLGGGSLVKNNLFIGNTQNGAGGTVTHNAGDSPRGTSFQTLSSSIFTGYANGNYTLARNTDAGDSLGAIYNTDMNAMERSTWSRGAFEYGSNGQVSNVPPTVTLTSPSNGATFMAPADITLSASASDADGIVTKVEFFNGTTKLGEDASSPYTFAWSGVPAGSYSLIARARDDQGAVTTSAAVSVTIASAPTFSVGQQVMVNSDPSLRVRSTPALAGTVLGEQPYGATGTIVSGPVIADGYTWWQIDYVNAPDGWSIEGASGADPWLVIAPTQPPAPPTGLRIVSP